MAITKHIRAFLAALVVLPILTSCGTSALTAQSSYGDDLYQTHNRELLAEAEGQARYEAQVESAEREKRLRSIMSQATDAAVVYESKEEINPYDEILVEDFEGAYERRLKGFESPTYKMPSSYYNYVYGDEYKYAIAYDPAFYNVVVMGDQVWVEPRHVSSMFGTWGRPSFGLSIGSWGWGLNWGWNSPWYGYGYGWHNPYSYWGYNPYWNWGYWDPWHYPRYYHGGRYHPHWDGGYWGGGYWGGSSGYYRDGYTHWKNTPTSAGGHNRGYSASNRSSGSSGRVSHYNGRSSGVYQRAIENNRSSNYSGGSYSTTTRGERTSQGNVGSSNRSSYYRSGTSNRAGHSPSVGNSGTTSRSSTTNRSTTPSYNRGSSSSSSGGGGAVRGGTGSRGGGSGGSSGGRVR